MQERKIAQILGYSGIIPYLFTSIFVRFNFTYFDLVEVITIYSYIIITFLGGIYWGITLISKYKSKFFFLFSVTSSVLILISLFLNFDSNYNIIFIIILINTFLFFELRFFKEKFIPKWFFTLRIKLNVLLTFFLIVIFLRLFLF